MPRVNEIDSEGASSLSPQVEVACAVCRSARHQIVASAAELEAQMLYLRRFHTRRMRPSSGSDDLAERAEFTQNYATDVVVCTSCGLIFRNPRAPAARIAEAYVHDTYGLERLRALHDTQLELFRPKAQTLRRWLATRRDPVVIEIGSFVGGFLAAAREQGWRVLGIDPGEEVGRFCASLGLSVLRENVEACEFPADAADCVAIWSTFDQLPTPHPTLTAIRKLLRPDGLLALRFPNGACFQRAVGWIQRWPRPLSGALRASLAWNNLLGFPYLFGYSAGTLDRLLAHYDFERVGFRADVLVRLADARTRTWAKWEERSLKALWRVAAAADLSREPRGSVIAPWCDAYYRLRAP